MYGRAKAVSQMVLTRITIFVSHTILLCAQNDGSWKWKNQQQKKRKKKQSVCTSIEVVWYTMDPAVYISPRRRHRNEKSYIHISKYTYIAPVRTTLCHIVRSCTHETPNASTIYEWNIHQCRTKYHSYHHHWCHHVFVWNNHRWAGLHPMFRCSLHGNSIYSQHLEVVNWASSLCVNHFVAHSVRTHESASIESKCKNIERSRVCELPNNLCHSHKPERESNANAMRWKHWALPRRKQHSSCIVRSGQHHWSDMHTCTPPRTTTDTIDAADSGILFRTHTH